MALQEQIEALVRGWFKSDMETEAHFGYFGKCRPEAAARDIAARVMAVVEADLARAQQEADHANETAQVAGMLLTEARQERDAAREQAVEDCTRFMEERIAALAALADAKRLRHLASEALNSVELAVRGGMDAPYRQREELVAHIRAMPRVTALRAALAAQEPAVPPAQADVVRLIRAVLADQELVSGYVTTAQDAADLAAVVMAALRAQALAAQEPAPAPSRPWCQICGREVTAVYCDDCHTVLMTAPEQEARHD